EHTDGPAIRQESIIATLHVEDEDGTPKVVRRTDQYGRFWTYVRNADGQVIETDSFDGQRTGIVYEQDDPESPFAALRRPLPFRLTDADGRTEELRYDAFGRVVRARSLLPSGQAVATT